VYVGEEKGGETANDGTVSSWLLCSLQSLRFSVKRCDEHHRRDVTFVADFFKELTQKWSSVGCLSLCTAADVDKKANNDNASGDAIRIYQRSSLSSSK